MTTETCSICSYYNEYKSPPSAPNYLRPRSNSFFTISLPKILDVPHAPHYARPRSNSFFKIIPPIPDPPHYARPRSNSFFNL